MTKLPQLLTGAVLALALVSSASAQSDDMWDVGTADSGSTSLATAGGMTPQFVRGQINCKSPNHAPDATHPAFSAYTTCDSTVASISAQLFVTDGNLNIVATGNPTQCSNCTVVDPSGGNATLTAGHPYVLKYVVQIVIPPMFRWTSWNTTYCAVQGNFQTLNCTFYRVFTA